MASSNTKSEQVVKHPYFPKSLKLAHYVPNSNSAGEILALAGAIALLVVVAAWVVTGRRKEPFCYMRRVVLCWFMLCAVIHTILEGYFSVYHATLAGHSTFLGQMWKEYSKSDSRYLTSDNFMVCMETITAVVDGPLAFVTFFAFLKGNKYRYVLQIMVSLFQLYGDTLYFMTEIREGFQHGPYGHRQYFWFYFFFLNMLWIVIPILLIIDAARHMAATQVVSDFYIDEYNSKTRNRNNYKKDQ